MPKDRADINTFPKACAPRLARDCNWVVSECLIVVLGATGDVGSVVVSRLEANGFSVLAPTKSELDLTHRASVARYFGAIARPYGLVLTAFIARARGETLREYEINQTLVNNVASLATPTWMVFTSSIAVYGESPRLPINENSELSLNGLYARAKREAEIHFNEVAKDKFPCLCVRLPGVFGGAGPRHQALDRILTKGLESGEINLGANGNVLRDWVSAREFAEFLLVNVENPRSGLVNFVRGKSISIDDYVAIALEVLPKLRHHRASTDDIGVTSNFVFGGEQLNGLFPDWRFPHRERDLHALARDLENLHEQKKIL